MAGPLPLGERAARRGPSPLPLGERAAEGRVRAFYGISPAALAGLVLAACIVPESTSHQRKLLMAADDGDPESGHLVFNDECSGCHGPDGAGVLFSAPALIDNALTLDQIVWQVDQGGFQMPGFADEISDEEIADVSAYVHSIGVEPAS